MTNNDFKKINQKIINLRNAICQKMGIKLIRVFDTNEHEPHKDVILGLWKNKKVVLRVGEHRPMNFFKNGYRGKFLVIPKSYLINKIENYEIEEYISGKMICEITKIKADRLYQGKNLHLLINAHWEFQKIAKQINFNKFNRKEKLEFFYQKGKKINNYKAQADEIIQCKRYNYFWGQLYPAKWKFAPDNLILTFDNKIGFIDLAGIRKAYWGYDLGWLIWPHWFLFSNSQYRKINEHIKYLDNFFRIVYQLAPNREKKDSKFLEKCWLIIFERLIGSFYDVAEGISHAKKNLHDAKRRKLFIKFINGLLKECLNKILNKKYG